MMKRPIEKRVSIKKRVLNGFQTLEEMVRFYSKLYSKEEVLRNWERKVEKDVRLMKVIERVARALEESNRGTREE